ncbi:hypothetical protein [Leifsonia xyli]|uniref:hypothetical protein n=1 Tax=Leifsonia xyli TaxID=1575 RepID=UPI003D6699DB
MATFNDHPHPRIIFNVPDDVYASVESMAGWAVRQEMGVRVHMPEFDLALVQSGNPTSYHQASHVMSIGSTSAFGIDRSFTTAASQINVEDPLGLGLDKLAAETIVPYMPTGARQTWQHSEYQVDGNRSLKTNESTGDLGGRITPFVSVGTEKYPYAWITRRHPGQWILVLPPETRDIPRWLAFFIRHLHSEDPEAFPIAAPWTERDEWSSMAASAAADALESHVNRAAVQIADLRTEETRLAEALEAARKSDEVTVRRLITADGDDLVDAVANALRTIGFSAVDMDPTHVDAIGARLEDLRVHVPGDESWVALAEVKGYAGGARVNDVSQITRRPVVNFIKETGAEPSTVWHIVNVERKSDPGSRRPVIPNDIDLEPLTAQGGALIDTRDLFRAVRAIEQGATSAATVRASLIAAKTRWVPPLA